MLMTQVNATDVRSNAMTWVDAHEPCDTTQVATTHIHVSTGVTHTHTHTHPTPCPARMHCSPPPAGPETTFKIFILTFTVMRRNLFWMTKRVHANTEGEVLGTREAAAREPSVLMVRRSQPADPARARLFRASGSARFPHAHGSSLSAPTSLVPQCRRVCRMWSAGMVFRH